MLLYGCCQYAHEMESVCMAAVSMKMKWRVYTMKRRVYSCNVYGWLRSVGSIKLYDSFAEYHLFYRAVLQKRPVIVSFLLTEATP